MSVKLALLKSGEVLISDIKELIDDEKVIGYLFVKPKKVDMSTPMFLSEENNNESSVEVSLSSWFLITDDEEFAIPKDWIVTVMNPVDRVLQMYNTGTNND
jgi:hypothetical protein|tara:strand:- start:1459 stop:1761 length:303 start_codon:yes stop_codon:yes gene_type:complete